MKDLKKLTRMQGGYFMIAFLFVLVMGIFGLYAVQYGDTLNKVHQNMMSYGFRELHIWLGVALLVVLLVRTFFAGGRENAEFLQTLPVKKKSWYIFDTVAGIVFILAIHLGIFFIYALMMKLDATQMVSLGKLFVKGVFISIAEYHIFLLVGHFLKMIFQKIGKQYLKYIEKGEEKRWTKHTN